jgi:hypothetical protein
VSRWPRLLAVLCVLLGAGGCSIKMMYNNADRFARWAANDYVRMNDAQEAYFDAEVDALHYWHRTEELPRYADYLSSLPRNLEEGVDESQVQGIIDTFYSWFEALEARAMPMVTELLLSLTDEQVARLPERLARDNDDLSEDEQGRPLAEVQARWAKNYGDTMSRFSGRLTREQRDYLSAQSVRYVPQFELWADYRQRWQGDLLKLLVERHDVDAFVRGFERLTARREDYYGTELKAVFDANEALAREVTAWLLSNLNEDQRERFYERTDELATTFRELAAEAPKEIPRGGGCLVRCAEPAPEALTPAGETSGGGTSAGAAPL